MSTAGGSTVSEVIEVAAMPTGPLGPLATTIETDAARRRIAARNSAGSSSGIVGYPSAILRSGAEEIDRVSVELGNSLDLDPVAGAGERDGTHVLAVVEEQP